MRISLLPKNITLFNKTRELEQQIDEFFDKVSQAGLVFSRALEVYLAEGACDEFEAFLKQVADIEGKGDTLRRAIEIELYAQTLIPDLRGDVLRLLEDMDHLMNVYEGNLYRISIQQPDVPKQFHAGYLELTRTVVTCVESVVLAARCFFRDINAVRDHNSKVIFYETEADKLGTKLQRAIFASDLSLDRKMHLRYFVERIDELANSAEDVADTLAIYAIKRRV
jgi:predicted phosphate transport protein (TIGR00153 family)